LNDGSLPVQPNGATPGRAARRRRARA